MSAIVEVQPKPPATLGEQLKSKQMQFQAALPAHIPVERFVRVVMTAIQNNPALADADRSSLWNASMRAAQDGLLPDGREGALVIYNTKVRVDGKEKWIAKVQWMPMIAGLRKKVRNSGEIATWDAQVVHAKDEFDYELGDDPFIKHKPYLDGDPGPVIAAYSVATLKSGEKSREVMTRAQIEKVRNASKAKDSGPWRDWYEEMCRKTVARRHSKVLPMSTDLDDLMRRDNDLYDFDKAREEGTMLATPKGLSAKLDMLATLPAAQEQDFEVTEDGEIIDAVSKEQDAPDLPASSASEHSDGATAGVANQDGSEASARSDGGLFPGDTPTTAADPQPLDPIAMARRRGAVDRNKGAQKRAMPPEYRDKGRESEARAWQSGWDNSDDVLAEA